MAADVLGPGFEAIEIPLAPDAEGPVVATLVRRVGEGSSGTRPAGGTAVLYVHGFADYFFHPHVADAVAGLGLGFYALDLRKYGRSLRPWQTPNHATSLEVYDEELDAAVAMIRAEGHQRVVVMGHSLGGLITSLWAHRRRGSGAIDALVLNSPWLDLRGSWLQRTVLTQVLHRIGPLVPRLKVGELDRHYGHGLHVSMHGEWDYDLTWKPFRGFPVLASWISAVRRGHAAVAAGLSVDVPVLVLTSHADGRGDRWSPEIRSTEVVLSVHDMWRLAPRLGADVTVTRIEGGMHDLSLSPEPVRSRYLDAVASWLVERSLG